MFVGRSGGRVASCRLGVCGVSTHVRREGCRGTNVFHGAVNTRTVVLMQSSTRCIFIARVPVVSMSGWVGSGWVELFRDAEQVLLPPRNISKVCLVEGKKIL